MRQPHASSLGSPFPAQKPRWVPSANLRARKEEMQLPTREVGPRHRPSAASGELGKARGMAGSRRPVASPQGSWPSCPLPSGPQRQRRHLPGQAPGHALRWERTPLAGGTTPVPPRRCHHAGHHVGGTTPVPPCRAPRWAPCWWNHAGVTMPVSRCRAPRWCHHTGVTTPVSPRWCHHASVTTPVSPRRCHQARRALSARREQPRGSFFGAGGEAPRNPEGDLGARWRWPPRPSQRDPLPGLRAGSSAAAPSSQ